MLPRIIFDTISLNSLEDSGISAVPLMKGLACGFDVFLTGISIDEIVATPQPGRREALLRRCNRLLETGKCLWPQNEIVRLLIAAHVRDAANYDWTSVDIRARPYELGIARRSEFVDDLTCEEQRRHHFKAEKDFKKIWTPLRPKLDAILAKDPSKRPSTFEEAAAIAERPGGVLWGLGAQLYSYISITEPNEDEIRFFMDVCPPFRAACYGLIMAWFNWSLRPQSDVAPAAGRNDLMSSVYLPYCGRFVSDDWACRRDLRAVAARAQVDCAILSLQEFQDSFALVA